ncbi:hypothetical protein TpMuguga_01g00703 [Theileria parva strain Muguga]|uniref:Uncharacterized protein n=1 Tax=Theileria parva TaxID=5875 RepID=Q4N7W7_THEPA|nr:uncharacterized protein TpMuguga_01g00703 [Theileria parva strain Muguga]EAN33941.1 hypothetical protein TpMuguga_01g00703 [Theileria parva strain Muguga]|eukprot:XP_766224.1 hypothetical protein [Theileria parva strain Muguga]
MRRNEDIKIHVSYKDLEKLFNQLVPFLSQNPIRKHENMALSFGKIIRYTIVKSVPYYKHSYLFVDVLNHVLDKKFGPSCCSKDFYETFCDKYSPNGRELFQGFVKRCLDGNCYVFDDYTLFKPETDQDENAVQETNVDAATAEPAGSGHEVGIKAGPEQVISNYILPNLSEVNLVFYLLKHTNFKYGKFSSFFTNRTRPRAEIKYMTPRLMYVNKIKFQVPNETHEIIQKFLYYSAIYFVKTYRETWITRGARHFANWDVKPKLREYLLGIGNGRPLVIEQEEIEKIIPKFKEYLLNSYYRNHPRRVDNYVGKMDEVLTAYYNDSSGDICCCSKPCIECQ